MKAGRKRLSGAVALALAALAALWWWHHHPAAEHPARGTANAAAAARSAGSARMHADARIDVRTLPRAAIEGTIRDASGAPVASALVCGFAYSQALSDEETRDPTCVHSQADGRYRLERLWPARYQVYASAERYVPGAYREENDDDEASTVTLAAGQTRRDIDVVLSAGGVELAGVVKDIGGGPVEGARVYAQRHWSWQARGGYALTRTAADGSFHLWVAPGTQEVTAEAEGYAQGQKTAHAPSHRVEILLTPGSVLAGVVVEAPSGAPVAGARVTVGSGMGMGFAGGDSGVGSALTDDSGHFRLTRLLPGRYKPAAATAGGTGQARESVLLGVGQTVDDVRIELHPAALVTGRVLAADDHQPCPKGWVLLSDAATREERRGPIDPDGSVELRAVLPGSYKVTVTCEGFLTGSDYPSLAVTAGRDPAETLWTVERGGRIRGRVHDAGGAPLAGATIQSRPADVKRAGFRGWKSVRSRADGSFVIEGVAAGSYKVSASAEGFPDPPEPTEVTVPAGGETEIDLALAQGGVVAGEVVDAQGQPVAGVSVRARGKARWGMGDRGMTDDSGSFRIEGLSPGSYRIVASRGWMWGESLRAPGTSDDDVHGKPVEVAAGQTAHVHLVVESEHGAIHGVVTDPAGAPVSDAFVDAERESDSAGARAGAAARAMRWTWSRTPVLTDTDGGFSLDKLSPGTYTVRAYRKGGGETEVEHVALGAHLTMIIRPTASIEGTVAGPRGAAPERFTVTVTDEKAGFRRGEDFFMTGGAFAMRDLPAGDFKVHVEAAEGVGDGRTRLDSGQRVTGMNVTLSGRATVTGRIVTLDGDRPLAGYYVRVSPLEGATRIMMGADLDNTKRITGPDGRFEVDGAPTGRVRILAFPMDWQGAPYGPVFRVATIGSGDRSDVGDLRAPPNRIKGDQRAGDLGFTLKDPPPDVDPAKVERVVALIDPKGPAAGSGLQVGDSIVSVDGHDVTGEYAYLYHSLTRVAPGARVTLGLSRGASVTITAAEPR